MPILKRTKVVRVGTSNAIVVPKELLRAAKLDRGDVVEIGMVSESIIGFYKVNEIK